MFAFSSHIKPKEGKEGSLGDNCTHSISTYTRKVEPHFRRPMLSNREAPNDIHLFLENYRAWDKDRYMSPDITCVKNLLKDEKIWNAAKNHMEKYHTSQVFR